MFTPQCFQTRSADTSNKFHPRPVWAVLLCIRGRWWRSVCASVTHQMSVHSSTAAPYYWDPAGITCARLAGAELQILQIQIHTKTTNTKAILHKNTNMTIPCQILLVFIPCTCSQTHQRFYITRSPCKSTYTNIPTQVLKDSHKKEIWRLCSWGKDCQKGQKVKRKKKKQVKNILQSLTTALHPTPFGMWAGRAKIFFWLESGGREGKLSFCAAWNQRF